MIVAGAIKIESIWFGGGYHAQSRYGYHRKTVAKYADIAKGLKNVFETPEEKTEEDIEELSMICVRWRFIKTEEDTWQPGVESETNWKRIIWQIL